MVPFDQAANYIHNIPGAVSGAGGHNQTYHVAAALIEGFGLSIGEARPLLQEYAAGCTPPWSEREIEHKLNSVKVDPSKVGKMVRKGVRWKLTGGVGASQSAGKDRNPPAILKPAAKPARYEISDSLELPEPIDDGARKFIRAAFGEGEGIRIAQACPGDDGRESAASRSVNGRPRY